MTYSQYLSKQYRPPLEQPNIVQYTRLDKNEPPFSAFESVNELFNDFDISNLKDYPNPYTLYQKLKDYLNIDITQLLITNGSEQAIEFVFRVFLEANDKVVYLNPSFAMFDVFAYHAKATIKHINFDDNISIDIQTILQNITAQTKLFVLANPNNPTGTAYGLTEIEMIAKHTQRTDTIFLLDEAYFHYYNIDSISLVKKYSNLIITRTFSKAVGLAGARIGYAISQAHNINLLRKIKPIDEINSLSMIIAQKALESFDTIVDKNVRQVEKWKKIFQSSAFKNITYIETYGNFILLKSSKYNSHKQLLLDNFILPKMDFKESYLKNCFRFSITTDDIMNKVFSLLKE